MVMAYIGRRKKEGMPKEEATDPNSDESGTIQCKEEALWQCFGKTAGSQLFSYV